MNKVIGTSDIESEKDLVLREVWCAKDALAAAHGGNVDKLFDDLQEREKLSGHRIVNLSGVRESTASDHEQTN